MKVTIYHAQCVTCGHYANDLARLRGSIGEASFELVDTRFNDKAREEHSRIISTIGKPVTTYFPVVDVFDGDSHIYSELSSW